MRTTAALIAAAALVAVTPSAVAAPPPLPQVEGVPVLGQAVLGNVTDDRTAVLSIHGVRRIEGATVLYYSMGLPTDQQSGKVASFSFYGNGNYYALSQPPGSASSVCTAAAIDVAGGVAYSALRISGGQRCLSTRITDFDAPADDLGRVPVGYTLLAPVPADVSTVDVLVGSAMVQDVPVEDGLLEPVSEENVPVVGTGWPAVDVTVIPTALDPAGAAIALRSQVKDVAKKVTKAKKKTGVELDIDSSVLFATDKATLTSKASAVINEAARQITAAGRTGKITVTGHTDSTASDAYNLDLSKRRAAAVAKALRPKLPSGITITSVGKGETDPIAPNTSAAGRALNRRVSITLPT